MRQALAAACLAAVAACLLVAAPAFASRSQETMIQDDPKIVYQDDLEKLDRTLATIKSLGIDTVRVSLFWHLVAPDPTSAERPSFERYGADHPGSYSEARWARYDRIVRLSQKHGLNVLFSITGPAPRWATPTRKRFTDVNNFRPSAREFRRFVEAVGLRYSGFWPVAGGYYLPRVTRWSIWNEPNFPNWLLPQWKRQRGRGYRPVSPHLYRPLVDAAWAGLHDSGHVDDQILLGETAPYGPGNRRRPGTKGLVSPPMFIREMYCLNKRFRPYRGRAARERRCPDTRAKRRAFRSRHPALFGATGWAHHAYSLTYRPTYRGKHSDAVPIGAVGRLTRTLDRAQFRWGAQSSAWSVWITEYGYQTLPPDPIRGVSWERQAAWMSWAEYLMFRRPRVASFAQFLLVDDEPRQGYRDVVERWRTWQSGLITDDGVVKPAFNEFRFPIHVAPRRARTGRAARVFGVFRPAPDGTPMRAEIQFRPRSGTWQTLVDLTTTNLRGYISRRVRPPGTGALRILWTVPGFGQAATRAAGVVRR